MLMLGCHDATEPASSPFRGRYVLTRVGGRPLSSVGFETTRLIWRLIADTMDVVGPGQARWRLHWHSVGTPCRRIRSSRPRPTSAAPTRRPAPWSGAILLRLRTEGGTLQFRRHANVHRTRNHTPRWRVVQDAAVRPNCDLGVRAALASARVAERVAEADEGAHRSSRQHGSRVRPRSLAWALKYPHEIMAWSRRGRRAKVIARKLVAARRSRRGSGGWPRAAGRRRPSIERSGRAVC